MAPGLAVPALAMLAGSACVTTKPVKMSAERPDAPAGSAFVNSLGMTMVRLPSASFRMGSRLTPGEVADRFGGTPGRCEDEHPLHRRVIDRPLYVAGCEVTVGQFRRFVEAANYETDAEREGWAFTYGDGEARREDARSWRSPGFAQSDLHPVVCVSWDDARAFCRWLSRREGRIYRLPTEAEWEYACRAGTQGVFWWGDAMDETGCVANVADAGHFRPAAGYVVMPMDDGYAFTAPVGSYRGNAFGLFDMIGNVSEWCEDIYGPYPGADWVPGHASTRVARGGSWYNVAYYCRCAYRYGVARTDRYPNVGFRVVADTG
jgi:formylglycine-generating enzyme required for sulfatase activity